MSLVCGELEVNFLGLVPIYTDITVTEEFYSINSNIISGNMGRIEQTQYNLSISVFSFLLISTVLAVLGRYLKLNWLLFTSYLGVGINFVQLVIMCLVASNSESLFLFYSCLCAFPLYLWFIALLFNLRKRKDPGDLSENDVGDKDVELVAVNNDADAWDTYDILILVID